jgi:hypothetical protein
LQAYLSVRFSIKICGHNFTSGDTLSSRCDAAEEEEVTGNRLIFRKTKDFPNPDLL